MRALPSASPLWERQPTGHPMLTPLRPITPVQLAATILIRLVTDEHDRQGEYRLSNPTDRHQPVRRDTIGAIMTALMFSEEPSLEHGPVRERSRRFQAGRLSRH